MSPYPFVCLSHPVCRCMCVCASITHSCLSSLYVCMYSPFFLSFIRSRSPMTPVSFCFVALVGRVMFASVRAVHLHASAPFSLRDTTVSLSVFRQYVLCYVYACASVSLLRDSGLVFILCSCVLCIHHSTRCASREALRTGRGPGYLGYLLLDAKVPAMYHAPTPTLRVSAALSLRVPAVIRNIVYILV